MQLFYTPDLESDIHTLDKEESRHISKVLRLSDGDVLHLTDGKGRMMKAKIIDPNPRAVVVEVFESIEDFQKRKLYIHMLVAPTKNIDRFEWFLEKATEIGVDEITPILCEHSERKVIRHDRLEKVISSAMKQSLKAYHPKLNELTKFKDAINKGFEGRSFIAHLDEENPQQLKAVYQNEDRVQILIGPEGDFSPKEIDEAVKHGFEMVAMGGCRLRTETAAVVACHSINLLFD
jgi:16S rRNA (uracil1498-N3)-methyltransferase